MKHYLILLNRGAGHQDETIMVSVAGDQIVQIDNRGREPSDWLKKEILKKVALQKNSGPEQA